MSKLFAFSSRNFGRPNATEVVQKSPFFVENLLAWQPRKEEWRILQPLLWQRIRVVTKPEAKSWQKVELGMKAVINIEKKRERKSQAFNDSKSFFTTSNFSAHRFSTDHALVQL